ncbi:hypothetical protein niasHS_014049 [Heterodera schachtii]|uniref:Uncharacterized protein n=1 Tax=Heterodera schachtii TaxID=97005 RepID=A0ABD2IKU4_HETSC
MCSKNDSSVRIDLKRCPCIHSLAQLVDVTLQSLLYQRQMIPEPASTLLHGCTPVADQFRDTYQKVQQILRGTFRSANGDGRIREFVILVGATPFSPKEIYRVRVPPTICRPSAADQQKSAEKAVPTSPEGGRRTMAKALVNEADDNDNDYRHKNGREEDGVENGGGRGGGTDLASAKCRCGGATVCDALNAKERRLVFSAVALSKTAVAHFEGCKVPGKMEKVFMFIRTSGLLADCAGAEGLEEDDSFEVPDREMKRRRKIRQLRIQVNAPCIVQQQQQQQPPRRQRHRKSSETNDGKTAENGTATEENDENVAAATDGASRRRAASGGGGGRHRRLLHQKQRRLRASGGDNGANGEGESATTPTATATGADSEQYNNDDEGDEDHCNDEDEEEEELATSTWYRLGPFFTNLC